MGEKRGDSGAPASLQVSGCPLPSAVGQDGRRELPLQAAWPTPQPAGSSAAAG